MDHIQRFGIEEEYFIIDLRSRRLLAEPSARVSAACREAIGEGFSYEMFQGQVEVASPCLTMPHTLPPTLAACGGN